MTLRFGYQLAPTSGFVIPLGGRTVRPRPVIAVTVVGPAGSRIREAILDTASDDTVFSDSLAAQIGVDLTDAPTGRGSGVDLVAVPLRYAEAPDCDEPRATRVASVGCGGYNPGTSSG
jgi:hypothetical protein